ncbi:MAG TPA: CAP domain-containing protein [Jiangellales bacterium]|nr:CAP domain-containing protein [Jiangellales bacterium]
MPRQRELSERTSHPRPGTHRRRRGARRRPVRRRFGRPEALALLAGLTIAGAGYLTANAILDPGGDDVTVQMDPVEEPSADARDVLDRLPASASRGVQRPTASPTQTPTRPTATPTGPTTTATPENTPSAVPSPEPAAPEPEPEPEPPEPDPAPPPRPSPSPPPSTTASAPSSGASAAEAAVVDIVNEERARAGCPSVRGEAALHELARGHSADMAARGYFDHTDPDGRTPWDRAEAAGISGVGGENIAMGAPDARSVMDMWMDSPGHRANILNCDFTRIGVGMHAGSGGGPWWTQVFGY